MTADEMPEEVRLNIVRVINSAKKGTAYLREDHEGLCLSIVRALRAAAKEEREAILDACEIIAREHVRFRERQLENSPHAAPGSLERVAAQRDEAHSIAEDIAKIRARSAPAEEK